MPDHQVQAPPQLTDAGRQFIAEMAMNADLAELGALREALGKPQPTIESIRQASAESSFTFVTTQAVKGTRCHLGFPHLFADVLLHARGETKLRVRVEDVKRCIRQLQADGVLPA